MINRIEPKLNRTVGITPEQVPTLSKNSYDLFESALKNAGTKMAEYPSKTLDRWNAAALEWSEAENTHWSRVTVSLALLATVIAIVAAPVLVAKPAIAALISTGLSPALVAGAGLLSAAALLTLHYLVNNVREEWNMASKLDEKLDGISLQLERENDLFRTFIQNNHSTIENGLMKLKKPLEALPPSLRKGRALGSLEALNTALQDLERVKDEYND